MAVLRMIDARWARLMVQQLKADRIPIDPILKAAGLTRRQVSDPDARIPYKKHAALLSLAAEATGDGCFGLRLTTTIAPKQVGLLGYVLLNSATLGDALKNLRRYFRVLTDALEFELEADREQVVLIFRIIDPLVLDRRYAVEWALGAVYRVLQLIIRRDIGLDWVEFQHPKPDEASTVRRIFGAPVHYLQGRSAIAFHPRFLDCPIEAADSDLLKILKDHCQLILGSRPQADDLTFEVRRLITTVLPSGQPRIETVAREFGMSSRTLARRLAEEGRTFKGLVDEVRRQLAFQYLKDERISFKQIAYLLGYSEVSAFYHAFRRWSGASPLQHKLAS
ncbi:MAG: AraC family transcriptional regulator [Kiloniellales bacterium]|nr:AraC family transcriptional regulator [Kiloniellales bacterium]